MPRLHALELVPDDAGLAVVRADWQRLRDSGLPSMLDRTGATNSPHVTVVSAPALTSDHDGLAADLLGPLLPLDLRAVALDVLGADDVVLTFTELRRWDPEAEQVRTIAGPGVSTRTR